MTTFFGILVALAIAIWALFAIEGARNDFKYRGLWPGRQSPEALRLFEERKDPDGSEWVRREYLDYAECDARRNLKAARRSHYFTFGMHSLVLASLWWNVPEELEDELGAEFWGWILFVAWVHFCIWLEQD